MFFSFKLWALEAEKPNTKCPYTILQRSLCIPNKGNDSVLKKADKYLNLIPKVCYRAAEPRKQYRIILAFSKGYGPITMI